MGPVTNVNYFSRENILSWLLSLSLCNNQNSAPNGWPLTCLLLYLYNLLSVPFSYPMIPQMIKEILFPYPQSHSVAPVCFHARPVSRQIPVFHASMGLTDSNLCLLCLSSPPPCTPLLLFLCFCPKDGAAGKIDGKMYVYMCVCVCECLPSVLSKGFEQCSFDD